MSCITEILKLKGDKEFMTVENKPGEKWVTVEGGGRHKQYEYLIVLNTQGHRCGYVAVPPEHEYSALQKEISVHGGITFADDDHALKSLLSAPCKDLWLGFDCGHSNDLCDLKAVRKYYGDKLADYILEHMPFMVHGFGKKDTRLFRPKIRDYSYVEGECKSMIEQLVAA